ncbi:MAG TPA: hypothetical protein VIS95_03165 [Solirubrobacterales bacterium]
MRVPKLLRRRRERRRLLALVPFRNEMRFLVGLFENLAGQVDGVIALDDQSTDESRAFVESQPLLVDLLSIPAGAQGELEDDKNHRALVEAAWDHGPAWLLGIDVDERVERRFRQRAEGEIAIAEAEGGLALWVPFRELWGAHDRVRVDGLWGQKRKACLFEADRGHRFDDRRLHQIWAPWPPPDGEYRTADLRLYHLRMIRAEDREARVERYRRLDPSNEWQAIGYDYLVDEEGIELQPLEPGRDYVPMGN